MLVRARDAEDPSGYRFLDLDVKVEKGGTIKGDGADNVLVGSLGDDKISGKGGDDILHGDDVSKTVWLAGNDKLYGGSEADKFNLNIDIAHHNNDVVMDFESGVDKIRIEKDWLERGWLELGTVEQQKDGSYDVEIRVDQNNDDAMWFAIVQTGQLPNGYSTKQNTLTLKNVENAFVAELALDLHFQNINSDIFDII